MDISIFPLPLSVACGFLLHPIREMKNINNRNLFMAYYR